MENETVKQVPIKEQLAPLGEKIRAARWDKRLTLPALAELSGVSTVIIGQLEKNEMESITLRKLVNVANAVGLSVNISFEG